MKVVPESELSFRERLILKLAGREVVASVSGGKDSAAMCLFLMELELVTKAKAAPP